jgi:hypothetical protein
VPVSVGNSITGVNTAVFEAFDTTTVFEYCSAKNKHRTITIPYGTANTIVNPTV